MAEHELRSCQSVDRPYIAVRNLIARDATALFQRATTMANARAGVLDSTLKVTIAGRELERDVRIAITSLDLSGRPPSAMALPAIAVAFSWRAASAASLFPSMRAELTVYPLSGDETQLDLHGWYQAPGGFIGDVADALVGHRIAEVSFDRFLEDVVRRLGADAQQVGKVIIAS